MHYLQASIEVSRLREENIREKHRNELQMKSIFVDMETTVTKDDHATLQEKSRTAEKEVHRLTSLFQKMTKGSKKYEGG